MHPLVREQIEAEVRQVNEEARKRKGDDAEHFFLREDGVIDMIDTDHAMSDGGVPAQEIATLPAWFKVGTKIPLPE